MSDSYGPLLKNHLPTSQGPGYTSYHSDNWAVYILTCKLTIPNMQSKVLENVEMSQLMGGVIV